MALIFVLWTSITQIPFPIPFADVQESQLDLRLRRTKLFKRQNRVHPEEKEIRKQSSDPTSIATTISSPTLQKHESYPQYSTVKVSRNFFMYKFTFFKYQYLIKCFGIICIRMVKIKLMTILKSHVNYK